MGVDHRGSNILVVQQFLNGMNAIACFQQLGGKTMSKDVAPNRLGQVDCSGRLFDRLLSAQAVITFIAV
jgi:hypothetical protein